MRSGEMPSTMVSMEPTTATITCILGLPLTVPYRWLVIFIQEAS